MRMKELQVSRTEPGNCRLPCHPSLRAPAFLAAWVAAAGVLSPAGMAGQAPAVPVLVLEQEVSGLPGMKDEDLARQRLTIDLQGRRILLESLQRTGAGDGGEKSPASGLSPEGAGRIILRLDQTPPRIFEIDDRQKQYRVHEGDLNRLQEERLIFEQTIRNNARRLTAAEEEKILADNWIRKDGKRIVDVVPGGRKEILGRNCEEVRILENGRLVIRAWVAKSVGGGRSFYQLYRRLGTFSQEVLEKVAAIDGIPLEAEIKVITAAPAYDLRAVCVRVTEDGRARDADFEVPADYRKVEKPPPIAKCPICGEEFEWNEPGPIYNDLGREVRFCTRKCYEVYKAKRKESLKKPGS